MSVEKVFGSAVCLSGMVGWAVALAGLCKINHYLHTQGGKSKNDAALDTSVPWVVYWLEFVITIIAFIMIWNRWLRKFKQALLCLYGIVTTLLCVIAGLVLVPAVYYETLPTQELLDAFRLALGGNIACQIVNFIWLIFVNGFEPCLLTEREEAMLGMGGANGTPELKAVVMSKA